MERRNSNQSSKWLGILAASMRKIKPGDVMEARQRVYLPVSVAESKISNRFDTIPSGTLNPNADEIDYLRRLVMYKGNLPVDNSMGALAAAALHYDYEEGPNLDYHR
ncbi:hypothetical protein SAY87_003707 [Trapa incisa]|uniref:Uncharacterized protein n=1 Tax=Trapa incisa TaxID=236973 RepID=A0AAN7KJS2_9MYRT|nr:hypothetical protein SAY87_003707 [Trapa incisa]